ncbi:MFS transporter, partial [Myxococcota bacterium]|nr:MFS transporter [Myxococcota bacterium]
PLPREVRVLLLGLSMIILCRAGMKAALTIYLPTFLTARGQSLWMAGLALSLLQFSGTAGVFAAGIVSDRLGRRRSLLIMNVGAPLLMLIFLVTPAFMQLPLFAVMGLFVFGTGPVILSEVHQLKRPDMAYINGLYMTLNFVLNSLMILLVGLGADTIGYISTWWIAMIIAFVAVPMTFILKEDQRG